MIIAKDSRPRQSTGPFRSLLVTDLDGTVVDRSDRVSPSTSDAMKKLALAGWDVAVATGRTLSTSIPHMDSIGSNLPAVVYDGGRVMDRSGRVIWQTLMDRDLARSILRIGWDYGLEVQVMGDEVIFCRPEDTGSMEFFDRTGVSYDAVLTDPTIPDGDIFRVMFFDPSGIKVKEMSQHLKSSFAGRAEVVFAGDGFIDVLPYGVNKGNALYQWVDFSNIKYDTIVAVGDNENDLELLRMADIAVAVSSAPEDLLSLADWIVPPPEEDGPSALVDKLLNLRCEGLKYI